MGRRVALLTAAIVIAAIGTTLVYLYAKQANDRAIADAEPQNVLVASALIPAGTTAEQAQQQNLMEIKSIPRDAVAPGAIGDIAVITGQVAVGPIQPGQQILTQLFSTAGGGGATGFTVPKGYLAASYSFGDTARVAGFLTPGSEVAVFLTSPAASDDQQPTTRMLLPSVKILAVGPSTITPPVDPAQANPEAPPRATMTIAVTQKQLETLVFAQTQGELYLGLLGEGTKAEPDNGVNADNLFN